MQQEETKNAAGHKQSDFAGTNPDNYGQPKPENEQDNPINDAEAQNVTDGERGLTEEETEHAKNKATEGIRQGRDKDS